MWYCSNIVGSACCGLGWLSAYMLLALGTFLSSFFLSRLLSSHPKGVCRPNNKGNRPRPLPTTTTKEIHLPHRRAVRKAWGVSPPVHQKPLFPSRVSQEDANSSWVPSLPSFHPCCAHSSARAVQEDVGSGHGDSSCVEPVVVVHLLLNPLEVCG
jgi:hypothetical protein